MRKNRLRNSILAAAAPIGVSLLATPMAGAQTATYTNTYNTSSSITTINAGVYDGSSENWRFDYGGSSDTPKANHSVSWSGAEDNTPATEPNGGSVNLTWLDSEPSGGSSAAAFTTDLFAYPGNNVTNISFDLLVAASSPVDTYGGYGYFQLFTRNENYSEAGTSVAEELNATPGVWQHFNVSFSTPAQVRALTWQDFNDATRDMNGTQSWFIDNLSITYQVPEPASLGLLGAGIPALLMRRRSKGKIA
jgi:hypothetical protein